MNYFPYYNWKSAAATISAPLGKDERNVVIGHSWGGANAIAAATVSKQRIDLLITIDPVGVPPVIPSGSTLKPGNVDHWSNVLASPSSPNPSDVIAFLGGGKTPALGADDQSVVDANHEDFQSMMKRSGNENRLNTARSGEWSIDGSVITGTRGCASRLTETGC